MLVSDEALWQQQRAELLDEGEVGKKFLEYLEQWASEAERRLDSDDPRGMPATAVSIALAATESRLGKIPATMIGDMLILFLAYWKYADELASTMTHIEMCLAQDSLRAKIEALQTQAVDATDEENTDVSEVQA